MTRRPAWYGVSIALLFLAGLAAGCSRDSSGDRPREGEDVVQLAPRDSVDAIWRVQEFRRLAAGGWVELARAFTNDNPRRWEGERQGIGEPWDFATATLVIPRDTSRVARDSGEHWFGTTRQVTLRTATGDQVYFLDERGKITGVLVRPAGGEPTP